MATNLHPTLLTTSSPSSAEVLHYSLGLAPGAAATQIRSPWHSPVPYLFGGLAAMLGLIAFALLILACSYWRLSSEHENRDDDDLEKGEGINKTKNPADVFEEKIVVIMAGNDTPTFLANPVQLFLNPTPNNQHLTTTASVSEDDDSSTSSGTSTTTTDDNNDKAKDEEP